MSDPVRVEKRGHIMEVTLDRPKVNAIDLATSRALGAAFQELQDDPNLRVGIVTAAGDRIFSAGWDLKAAHQNEEVGKWWETTDYGPGGFAGLTELWGLNKPVIAAVNGLALGGGFELVIACDLIICAEHVEFALPELPIGIVPDSGGIQRVPRRLPHNIAMELLLLGRRMTAEEALHYGMINRIVPKDQPIDPGARMGGHHRRRRAAHHPGAEGGAARDGRPQHPRQLPPDPHRQAADLREVAAVGGRQGRRARLRREAQGELPGSLTPIPRK